MQGLRAEQIGDIAAAHGIALHELTPEQASLEEAFMRLTHDAVEYHASVASASADRGRSGGMSAAAPPSDGRATRSPHGPGHPAARRALGVDEALVAALDALVAARSPSIAMAGLGIAVRAPCRWRTGRR